MIWAGSSTSDPNDFGKISESVLGASSAVVVESRTATKLLETMAVGTLPIESLCYGWDRAGCNPIWTPTL